MFNWAKQTLANVAGTEEPIYGPSAIQSVAEQAKTTPYTELKRDDQRWILKDGTCVETQTFYFTADNGHIGMAQVIYSNVAGIRKTVQFNSEINFPNQSKPAHWTHNPLEKYSFEDNRFSFKAPGCSVTLSEDGKSYTIKSTVNKASVIDIKITQVAPGFVVGKDGSSTFGTDPTRPWGNMRHAFWPRCKVEGSILTQAGPIDFTGKGLYSHALQGMKPHHAAARWDFVSFQGPTYSALMMKFITPPSYGTTSVTVGGIVTDEKILFAGADNILNYTGTKPDPDNGWPVPTSFKAQWSPSSSTNANIEASYGALLDRVDVMAEVPAFVKTIVANAAGTKPYIYQFGPTAELVVNYDGSERREQGQVFAEATFISAIQ